MHRWQTAAVAAVAVFGAAGLGYAFHADGSTDQEMELTASATPAASHYTFAVRATPVENLYPGAVKQLRLTFANPYDVDLMVTDIRATLVATNRSGCLPIATNLAVLPYTGDFPVRVKANSSRPAGNVPLHMPNSVANECQEATFTITLHADATRAGR